MKEEELPANLRNVLYQLKYSSATIDYGINDSLDNATSVEDFQERLSVAMNKLIGEAECVKKKIVGEKDEGSSMSEILTVDDARQIAFETLRFVSILPGWESFKNLVGEELDLTDEMIDQAVGLLFK